MSLAVKLAINQWAVNSPKKSNSKKGINVRKHKFEIELKSNIDLTKYECQRLKIKKLSEDSYSLSLRLYKCEVHPFIFNTITRRIERNYSDECWSYTGNASRPEGIYL